ncbi:hypothetical protein CNMCM5623_003426 [Aspergillus felis]|uniref:RRM domain-containing protein n=1 Tax=Aspergillus felis TaxID=1287682 RepID=A0A8H6PPF0_9EURO|nr:hypothetical protein CNMCM5623_003426 [Aspergillus felis]
MALRNAIVLSDDSNSSVLCPLRAQVENGHNASVSTKLALESLFPGKDLYLSESSESSLSSCKTLETISDFDASRTLIPQQISHYEYGAESIAPWSETNVSYTLPPIDTTTGATVTKQAKQATNMSEYAARFRIRRKPVTNQKDTDDEEILNDDLMTPSDMERTGDATSRRANKSRDLDPSYDPNQEDEDTDEDDQFSLKIPKDGRRKRALDPMYTPSKDDAGEDDDDEELPRGSLRKKRRTLDPAFVPDEDDDDDQDKFLGSLKRAKGRTADKRTSKRKATSDIGVGNLPTPSKATPSRAAKRMKTEPAPPPRVPVSPALTDPRPDNSDEDAVTKNPWELVNAKTQPNHPLVLKAMKVLNKIADDRNKAFFALAKAHQRSRKSYPDRVADNTNDEAHTQGKADPSRKSNQNCDAVVQHSGSAARVGDTLAIQEDEANDSVPDLSLERAKRWANAVNVPKGLLSEVEKQLFYRIAMRGFEPLLPKQWHYDFSTLPNSLFAVSGEKPSPLINAIRGSEFYAIRSLSVLFSLGGYVRDCNLVHRRPEPIIKRAISKYIRWAVYDAGLHVSSNAIPLYAIGARKRGESTVKAVVKVNRRLQRLADRFRSAYGLASPTKELVAPANRAKAKAPNRPPLLTGFVISGPVVAILTLNTDPSAAKGQRGTEDSHFICQLNLSEQGQDVWNSLAVAISVMRIRNTMMELAEHDLAGTNPLKVQSFVMDDSDDREIKLQRASGDLVKEFSSKLPSLLWKPRNEERQTIRVPRRWTQAAKAERLINLVTLQLEPFQEWPQLLDPHLQALLPPLVDAFLAYLVTYRDQYGSRAPKTEQHVLYPLPRAICRLLYTFCKVRGVKVISRFLNNEPKYLDPMLRAFIDWDALAADEPYGENPRQLVWEERYMMLIWLSHLLLAPFDLSSLSSDDIPVPFDNLGQIKPLPAHAPMVAKSLLSVTLKYVNVPGKEREAATLLLARLILRRDMQALGLLTNLTEWAFAVLNPGKSEELPSVYTCIGVLSFLGRLGASGQVDEFAPLIIPTFERTLHIAQERTGVSEIISSSALARKIIIKILRTVTVMALSLSEKPNSPIAADKVSSILEESIDHLLVSLADKDTPVRFAASKALSIIALKLDPDMASEVIEAVTGSLEENILYEKPDGTIVAPFEARKMGLNLLKRNLNAVDAQRWQGLILTLGHLLFRRAPPTHQLPHVLQPLISGLDFEQRSSTGSSVGTGVRDASCFGIWAISRKYTTQELLTLNTQTISTPSRQDEKSILQMLATELVCAACMDPSGNIRRGASAALQELIGRHPNTIAEGIPLVQVVDYHAVARRSRAMIDVAKATAALSHHYWSPLVESLLGWRGIGSPDAESRRQAAKAIGELSIHESYKTLSVVLHRLRQKLASLPRGDVEARHGCLLSISATVDAFNAHKATTRDSKEQSEAILAARQVTDLWDIFSSAVGPTKEDLTLQISRPELTAEASSCLLRSLSLSVTQGIEPTCFQPSFSSLDRAHETLSLCLSRSEEVAIEASSEAVSEFFPLLSSSKQEETIQDWFAHIRATWKLPTGRGQISVLGAVFRQLEPVNSLRQSVVEALLRCTDKEELIEKRVVAVKSLTTGVLPNIAITEDIANHIIRFLNDYTTDRRGDVGSLLRLEAIQAAKIILRYQYRPESRSVYAQNIVGCLCRLAAEKLDKVRLQAWICLQEFWASAEDFPPLQKKYDHFSHVSSTEYFLQLLQLQAIDWLRLPLFQGLATSAVAGAEGLIRSTRLALVRSLSRYSGTEEQIKARAILKDLGVILSDNLHDDRYAIPSMEFAAFLLDGYVSSVPEESEPSFRKLFVLVQKAHFKTTNMARLEAATKVYVALCRLEHLRVDVLKKMVGMLLHPFPRIRSSVADYLFMETGSDLVKDEDWTKAPKQLKGQVRNLEERIKIDQLKVALEEIFSEYGNVVEIVAKTNLKAKGQAFIVFDDVESATRAIEEVNGFELFDKPMVLDYAKTKSDATVLREGGTDELEVHKRRRLAEKERKQAHEALEAQKKLKRPPGPADTARPAKAVKGAGLKPTSGAAAAVIPDEYLPPNKILFLRDLPDTADQDSLTAIFGRFEGFQEVRLVPGRKGIAFVEYENESGAISAKEATANMPMGDNGKPIRVTYQRQ